MSRIRFDVNFGFNTYTYDAEGRVCALNGPQGMVGYQYDADGTRIGKGTVTNWQSCDITANGYIPTTDFVLDQGGGQMSEVSVGGGVQNWVHTNVTANGVIIATYDTLGLHFYLNDALGSRRVQTDSAGIPQQTCQSLPDGDQLYCTGSLTSPTEQHFTGNERDSESGLDYFGARYYGSNMGRWMSPDWSSNPSPIPFGNIYHPQSLNLYSYVGNNPMTGFDPYGHLDCSGGATQDVACAVTTAAKAVWHWLSGGGSSSSSNGNSQTATAAPDPQFSVTSRIINGIYSYRPNYSGVGASAGYSAGFGRGVAGSAGADASFFTPDGYTSDPGDTKWVYSLSHGYTGLHWTQPGGVAMQTHDDDTVWGLGVGAEAHFNIGRSSGDLVGQSSGEQSSANGGIVYSSWSHSEGWTNYNFTLGLGLKGVGYTQMLMNTTTKQLF